MEYLEIGVGFLLMAQARTMQSKDELFIPAGNFLFGVFLCFHAFYIIIVGAL